MTRERFDTDQLLAWLGEVLKSSDQVDVDIVVMDSPGGGSALQITLSNLPGPLAGLQLKPAGDGAPAGRTA